MTRKQRDWSEWLTIVVNVLVIGAIGVLLLGGQGPLGSRLAARQAAQSQNVLIAGLWNDLSNGPRLYVDSDSVPVLVEFSDYTCRFCRAAHEQLGALASDLAFGIVYRHMPLGGPGSPGMLGARAAVCAEAQGRFGAMHDALFSDTAWIRTGDLVPLALRSGVENIGMFEACLGSEETLARIRGDVDVARRLRLRGTPTFMSPRGVHTGVPDRESVFRLLRK